MKKRLFDIIFASTAILIFSPLIVLCGLAIGIALGRPILFQQDRPGLNAKPFKLLKFRTMSNALDSNGNLLSDAERLTRLGRFLRSSSLDELPSLLNVLKGDMSLVGPRPLLMAYLQRYSKEQARRHDVRPGITGWAQINGRNAITWEEKFALDVWYVENRSLWLDVKILFVTAWTVVRRDGISHKGEATMGEFMGAASNASSP